MTARHWRARPSWQLCTGVLALFAAIPAHADVYWVTVAGLGGDADYQQRFMTEASGVDKALRTSGAGMHVFTLSGTGASRAHLKQILSQVAHSASAEDEFVLLLIGHGSFDGVMYKFNLPGPDISAAELAELCNAVPAKRQLIVDTTSASGGAVAQLQRRGRAVIAATKSGTEKNATIFSRYWLEALQDPTADVNKSGAITALQAYDYAARKTAEFYSSEKRLATEHPVFEDVGKGPPVRAPSGDSGEGRLLASFTLIRRGDEEHKVDPAKRDLLSRKDRLLQQIDALKYQKAAMAEQAYQSQLKALLLDLARTQAALDK